MCPFLSWGCIFCPSVAGWLAKQSGCCSAGPAGGRLCPAGAIISGAALSRVSGSFSRLGFGGCFFFRLFVGRVVFFRIFVLGFQVFPVLVSPFPSASSVVSAFGFSAVFGWFALCVQRVPPAPCFQFSERVAAACPRFASWLCGRLGCSWSVAWSVASLCASRVGVSVLSGGVAAPGVQLSLFS